MGSKLLLWLTAENSFNNTTGVVTLKWTSKWVRLPKFARTPFQQILNPPLLGLGLGQNQMLKKWPFLIGAEL